MSIEAVSVIVTSVSIIISIVEFIRRKRAVYEVKKLRRYLDFKKLEGFALKYRQAYDKYRKRVTSVKWNEQIKGKDVVGDMDNVLTEFNTHLPKMNMLRKRQLSKAIDDVKKEFAKVRKGDEDIRDRNLQHINEIDRILNEEISNQRNEFVDLI